MLHRSLIFLGILSLAAVASANPAGTATAANDASPTPANSPAIEHRNCLTQTGSMIQRKDGCAVNEADGDSYDQDDIRRTGATTVGGALRNLVPGATVGR
jgi:hypothetical protein